MPRTRRAPSVFLIVLALCFGAALDSTAPALAASHPSAIAAPIRVVRVGQIRVAYRSIGHGGRPLVVIEGTGDTMTDFDPVWIDRLAAHRRVILFDNRGVGRSTTTGQTLTVRLMADDAARLIRVLHLDRPDVLGCSLGGSIAGAIAAFHGSVIRRAVVCATGPGGGHWTPPTPRALQIFASNADFYSHAVQFEIMFTPDRAGRQAAARFAARVKRWKSPETISQAQFDQQKSADVRYDLNESEGIWDQAPTIKNKILVICGAEDILVPRQNCELLADNVPRAELLLYPAKHGFYYQYEARVGSDVLRFLGR